jgi:dipeptidyl aminopeptidase/acylaminoacyl peptidase
MRGAILACGCVALAHFAHALPAPAEAYGRLPAVFDTAISPDGTKVIMAVNLPDGVHGFRIVNLVDGEIVYGARVATARSATMQENLRGVGWADDGRALYVVSATIPTGRALPWYAFAPGRNRLFFLRPAIVDLETEEIYPVKISDEDSVLIGNLASLTAPIEGDDGYGRLIAPTGPFQDDVLSVYRINLASGRASSLLRGRTDTLDFILDRRGTPALRIDSDERSNRWSLRALDGTQARSIMSGESETGQWPDIVGMYADGRFGGVDRISDTDRAQLFAVDRTSGEITVLRAHDQYDIEEAITDPWSHEIVGALVTEDFKRQDFLDPDLAAVLAQVQARAPGTVVRLKNWSRDRSAFVVFIEQQVDAGGYYLFTPHDGRLASIGMRYPELSVEHLGSRLAITYPARDGTRIPAYLTTPYGAEMRNLPLVVLVHGGPTARDDFEFDWWASFLASRGYAVLQPNFRGSSGYGAAWEEAGYREWGRLMQTDVEDGALVLGRNGIADPERICIVGGSYGGFAALAGAALTPERYACAAAIAGVSDLPMMLSNVAIAIGSQSMPSDWWGMLIGDRREDGAALRAVSPAHQAANVRAPVLLIHGANDTVVPIAQSRRMADALRSAGKDVRLVEYPGEDHWLSDATTRIAMLRELETFLAAHLGAP